MRLWRERPAESSSGQIAPKIKELALIRGLQLRSAAKLGGMHGSGLMGQAIGSWRLFWALALATSTAICLGLPSTDFHSARGSEFIILRSVRCALPLFLVA